MRQRTHKVGHLSQGASPTSGGEDGIISENKGVLYFIVQFGEKELTRSKGEDV